MTQTINYIIQILTVCQSVWVITILGFIILHYLTKSVEKKVIEKNELALSVSYCLLTLGTMISSYNGFYEWYSLWQIIVVVAYVLGDYSILKMLLRITLSDRKKKIVDKYMKEAK